MDMKIENTYETVCQKVAEQTAEYIRAYPESLLCLAGGDTPLPVYQKLIDMQDKGMVNLHSVYYVSLDEWVGLGYEDKGSCLQMMRDTFYDRAAIPGERLCLLDGLAGDMDEEARRVSHFIQEKGGIGLAVLGIGMNGHIGFNEPDCPQSRKEGVIVVELDETTQTVGQKYFQRPTPVTHGITVSCETLSQADRVIYMACGTKKHGIVRQIDQSGPTASLPATLLKEHSSLMFYVDREAWEGTLYHKE